MHVHVLHPEGRLGHQELVRALARDGATVTADPVAGTAVTDAAALGHDLHDRLRGGDSPDVILAWGWLAGLAAQVATRDGGPSVVQRVFAPGRSRDTDRRRLEGALARGAARVLAVSSADVEALVDLGVRRSAIRVVPPGVDTTAFADDGPAWPVEGRRVVAGPHEDARSVDRIVAVLAALPPCELVLVTTPASRPLVTAAVTGTVVEQRVRLVDVGSAEVTATQLPALLRSADLVLATGGDEPEVELVVQAMASGVPAVALAVGVLPELIADGVTGLVAPTSPAEAFGDAARQLVGDQLRREAYGLAAGDRARASFDWSTVGAALNRVLDEVVHGAAADDVDGRSGNDDEGDEEEPVKSGAAHADATS